MTAAALDDPAEWSGFGRALDAASGRWESYLAIEGMHCPACALVIEDTLQGLPGVREVQVNGANASARVVWSAAEGRPSQWLAALQRAVTPKGLKLGAGRPRRRYLLNLRRREAATP